MRSGRVRAALFLSIADVFFGTGALILSLIVISAPNKDDHLVERYVDISIQCELRDTQWYVGEVNNIKESINKWINTVTKTGLLQRVGVEVERDEMECFSTLDQAARKHNRMLMERGNVASSLSIILLPTIADSEKP